MQIKWRERDIDGKEQKGKIRQKIRRYSSSRFGEIQR